jgi:hypothetical protein
MRKTAIILFPLLFSFISMANAQNDIRIGLFPLGFGVEMVDNEPKLNTDLSAGYLSLGFKIFPSGVVSFNGRTGYDDDVIDTGFHIEWIPVIFKNSPSLNAGYYSFRNFQIYWDIFSLIPLNIRFNYENRNKIYYGGDLGLFVSINYAPLNHYKSYLLHYGIKYVWGIHTAYSLAENLLNIECGFRLIENKNNFYFNVGIDAMSLLSELIIGGFRGR